MSDENTQEKEHQETSRFAGLIRHWYGGVGCRISFFMTLALVLVALLVGVFFYLEGRSAIETEIYGRAVYIARQLSALTRDDIITENRHELYKKLSPPFEAEEALNEGADLLFVMVYRDDGSLIVGRNASTVFFSNDAYFYTHSDGSRTSLDDVTIDPARFPKDDSVFKKTKTGVYDLILPVLYGRERMGFVRVGITGTRFAQKFGGFFKKAVVALIAILILGLSFSQIITIGITRPILTLSDAADKLSEQNWERPLIVRGKDEISRLGHAFNEMAQKLKQREVSLSNWNRDLFILHTAGLDLMESLEIETLVGKIAARADDLVRADTTAVLAVDKSKGVMKHLGVYGSKAALLRGQETPIEAGGIYNWLACYGTPLLIVDAQTDFRLDGEVMKSLGIKSLMTIPLWSSNIMTGLLTVMNKKGGASFDKHDLRLLTVFGNIAATALQNASFYTDLMTKMRELNNTQQQLIHSTKMAAIGELAANVAHEINNPLTSVLGYTTHLLKAGELPEGPRKTLQMMEQETLRVRKIIRNLLDFSRQKPSWMHPADLLIPIKETLALVQGMAEASAVRISEEYPPVPVIVHMDDSEIKQVFINIIYNAFQAMPDGGDLLIRIDADDKKTVAIEFIDSGIGVKPENISKIFEPFFSTKQNGEGTGLGLSISYRIAKNHGGTITAERRSEGGMVFRVVLPKYRKTPVATSA